MPNLDIRFKAKACQVPLWKLARKLGISDNTLFVRLRRELSATEKKKYCDAIMEIAAEQATRALTNKEGE